MKLYGGIEAGGTKFVCAIGTGPDDVKSETSFPTTGPEETIGRAVAFFLEQRFPLAAIGIGSFGPVDPDPKSSTYGYITTTPKLGWRQTDFAGTISRAVGVPVGFDSDVNAAALGEYRWGAAQGMDVFVYLTVGTGIGGGYMVGGRPVHGMMHPEMGHIRVPHDFQKDSFAGSCPYHGDCLEGLASGPAIEMRWGRKGQDLPPDHPGWSLEADYLALGLVNYTCTLMPRRIVMGGGVMRQAHLLPMIRARLPVLLNDYLKLPEILESIDSFVVPPGLGSRSGVLGAIALAAMAAEKPRAEPGG